jgi:WD40 repeat protein
LTYRRCIRFHVQSFSFKPRDFVCFNFLITIMVASSNKNGGMKKNKGSRSQKNRQNDEEEEGMKDRSVDGVVRLGGDKSLLAQVVVVAGTYDGVLAGWEYNGGSSDSKEEEEENESDRIQLKIRFASPIHNGSVRCLALNTTKSSEITASRGGMCLSPGMLVSVGFDDVIKLHDFRRHQTSRGEVRTPSEWGTPIVAALAPPSCATHCLVGFVTGKILIYATKDWSVQHVLSGHSSSSSASSTTSTCGVASLSVHPSGKLALSGGLNDGKLMLWDLTKGRLAHVNKVDATTKASLSSSKRLYEPIACIVWGQYGAGHEMYGYCYGNHITVRDVATGRELLDVELPSRVHQICFLGAGGEDEDHAVGAAFVAAACDDGSLPVLAVEELDDARPQGDGHVRRAVMAIEPVILDEGGQGGDGRHSAGEERFKCIQAVSPCHVVTANSAGVVSLMDLSGALRMLLEPPGGDEEGSDDSGDQDSDGSDASVDDDRARKDDDDEEEELAVDILDSVRLGSGARITCLAAWATHLGADSPLEDEEDTAEVEQTSKSNKRENESRDNSSHESNPKRKRGEVELDPSALEKARKLVSKAKKIQKRKRDKTQKKARAD